MRDNCVYIWASRIQMHAWAGACSPEQGWVMMTSVTNELRGCVRTCFTSVLRERICSKTIYEGAVPNENLRRKT